MFTFDGANKKIYIEPSAVSGSMVEFTPQQLWSEWIDWVAEGTNSKYLPAFESVMLPLDATTMLGQYLFIRNDLGWRGVPPVADHISIIINGSFYAKEPTLPVMENIPNQETDLIINRSTLTNTAIVGGTSGGSSYTLEQIAEAVWNSPNAEVSEMEFVEDMNSDDVIINSDGEWYPVGTAGMKSVIYNAGAYAVALRMGNGSLSDGLVLEVGDRISVRGVCYVRSQKTGNFNVRLVVTR